MRGEDSGHATAGTAATGPRLLRRCMRALPLVAALAFGLALAGCDKCGDFFWQGRSGVCHASPPPG
jgi:hypothetical protein